MRRGSRGFGWIPRLPVRVVLFLGVGLGVTALGLVAYGTDVLRNVELDSVDARFSIRGDRKPPQTHRRGSSEGDRLRRAVHRAEQRKGLEQPR